MLFDQHFLRRRGAPVLARALLPGPPPTARELLDAWHQQFASESRENDADLLALCDRFLNQFALNLRIRDEFRPFFDSTALDAVRDELRNIREHLATAPDPRIGKDFRGRDRFPESISARYAEFDAIVERLTADQFRVIDWLHGHRRALISGCAGSGKTLVAAEKAMRLSRAGISTLFLCHSHRLAEWVASLMVWPYLARPRRHNARNCLTNPPRHR